MTGINERLAAANARAKATEEAQKKQQEQAAVAQKKRRDDLMAAIAEFNRRVAPAAINFALRANGMLTDTSFVLKHQQSGTQVINTGGQGGYTLPQVRITAEDRSPTMRGGFQARVAAQPQTNAQVPWIEFSLGHSGNVAITEHSRRSVQKAGHDPVDLASFTDQMVEELITEFVESLIQ
jgi:hypothetical protein